MHTHTRIGESFVASEKTVLSRLTCVCVTHSVATLGTLQAVRPPVVVDASVAGRASEVYSTGTSTQPGVGLLLGAFERNQIKHFDGPLKIIIYHMAWLFHYKTTTMTTFERI